MTLELSSYYSLRLEAEAYFSVKTKREREDIEKQSLAQVDEALKHSADPAKINPNLLQNLSQQSSLEIVSLSLPSSANDYRSVSMYCDRNASTKSLPLNARATSIAKSCNHDLTVYGDVFLGKCHDDESLPWARADFSFADLSSDAAWMRQAHAANKGKSLNNFNTSGTLQNILSQSVQPAATASSSSTFTNEMEVVSDEHSGNTSWSQTSDEVEWRLSLAAWVKKSDIKISIRSNSVKLVVKASAASPWKHPDSLSSEDKQILQEPSGAELYSSVDVDSSTWTLESNVVCLSLCKQSSISWKSLLKSSE